MVTPEPVEVPEPVKVPEDVGNVQMQPTEDAGKQEEHPETVAEKPEAMGQPEEKPAESRETQPGETPEEPTDNRPKGRFSNGSIG